jgi:tetratricopeptide (TPR) repeat protein
MSRFKLFAFKTVTVLIVPLALIALLESGLRLVGFGYNTSVFHEEKGIVRNNWPFTFSYFPWSVARPMKSIQFPAKKEPGSIRVFVLGGSAAHGYPAPEYGMANQIQVMLEKAHPERRIEVINAAISAVNSHVMLPVAKACLEYDPDFLVVYMGNNEVAGPYGAGSLYTGFGDNLSFLRLSNSLKSLRLYQMLVMLAGRHQVASGTWKGMDFYLENAVFEDDDRLQTVYRHFERNLSDMLSAAAIEDCQVLLSTVAVNLLDCPPFISGDDGDAKASYQKGIALQGRGDVEGALAAFKEARDLDGLRMRADSQLNGIIRRLAGEQSAHVTLVDSEKVFEQSDRGGFNIPGDAEFYDHVHLSSEGNYKVASAFSEAVVSQLGAAESLPISRGKIFSELAFTPWDELRISREITEQLLSKVPYTNQWNHREKQLFRRRQVREMEVQLTPEAREKSLALYEAALEKRPGNADLKRLLSQFLADRGEQGKARELLRSVVQDFPKNIEAQYQLSLLSVLMNDIDEAEDRLLEILELNPYAIEARNAYLLMLFNGKRFDEAVRYNQKLLEDHPEDPDFHHVYASILETRGKANEAIEQLKAALRIDPKHEKSRTLMIETLLKNRQAPQALRIAQSWSLADPDNPQALNQEAQLLAQKNEYDTALELYKRAMDLDPDFVVARSNFVQLLVRQGRFEEAIHYLREQLAADPEIREGHSILGLALDVSGRRKEAMEVFESGLEREPNNVKILRELAWVKATAKDGQWRDGAEAERLAKRAVFLAPDDPDFQQVLAAAYAENRRFDEALETARRALRLAEANGNQGLSNLIRQCIPAYESGKPIRVN